MEASKASIMAFIEPLVASVCGVLVFREELSPATIVGIILIFMSVVLLNMSKVDTVRE